MKIKAFIRSTAHLPVKDLQQTLDYYHDKLGFYEEWTEGQTDGGIRRDNMLMLFGLDPAHVEKINSDAARLNLLWFVDNIQEVCAEFQDRGIKIEKPITDYCYGLREFAFIDINGYYIRIAERID
jgi:catechol 2,3-dioxygenase-like lactoylglutathione lyase family enzyme